MTRIVGLVEIERALERPGLSAAIEQAFIAYSEGRAVVPPVGELLFADPPGDVHIKYGYVKGGRHYVIKVASSFYRNPEVGLPSSDGLMLVSDARTGVLRAVLMDGGLLTNVRTAVAGSLCSRELARRDARMIGILGTGTQARLQLRHLREVLPTREALIWGRSAEAAARACREAESFGYAARVAASIDAVALACDVLVTTTPSHAPLLFARHLRPGMHITAVGADTAEKQELDASVIAAADLVVCDSRSQCAERGDVAHAQIAVSALPELGEILGRKRPGRRDAREITVADLTGVAVQDIAVAEFALEGLA